MSNKEKLIRNCPNPLGNPACKCLMYYAHLQGKIEGDMNGSVCASCRAIKLAKDSSYWTSPCKCGCGGLPTPGKQFIHGHHARTELNGFRGKKHTLEFRRRKSEEVTRFLADPNNRSFLGRRHSEESKQKMRLSQLGKKASEETKAKQSAAKKGYAWSKESIEKLKATKSTPEFKAKMSARFRGSGNPMYGKSSPIGSGGLRSIGGWFRGTHFRSSCELAFLMAHQDMPWKGAESSEFRLTYVNSKGETRHYFPDFFCDGRLAEVKPLGWSFHGGIEWTFDIHSKVRAAADFCEQRGWEYVMVELPMIGKKNVFQLRAQGIIQLDSKWERHYKQWLINR